MRLRALVLDETHDWIEEITRQTGRVFGIYLYDPDVGVHCAELTPSYELHFLHSVPESLPNNIQVEEKLLDDINEGDYQAPRIKYIHCHRIDALPKIKCGELRQGTYHFGRYRRNDFNMDEVEESYRENPDY